MPPTPSLTLIDRGALGPLRRFGDAGAAARALAGEVTSRLAQALSDKPRASLVVSGGRSPTALFALLAQSALPWERINITLADERWVANDSEASNEWLLRQHLLRGRAADARFVALKTDAPTPEAALADRAAALSQVLTGADVLVLGMGDDGHTASLFPDAFGIDIALDPQAVPALVAMHPKSAQHARISMNLAALVSARHTMLLLAGSRKLEVLARTCPPGLLQVLQPKPLPIAALWHHRRGQLDVFWNA